MATTTTRAPEDTSQLLDQAKRPASPAAGPYGHPFHPILVTIPIGAWLSALVFDIATKVKDGGSQHLAYASAWLIGIGLIGAVMAALFGLMDLSRLGRGTPAMKLGLMHMTMNLGVVALFAINLLDRRDTFNDEPKVTNTQLILTLVALAILSASGWIGGKLAYHYGVRVAHETDQAEGFRNRV
jgi:uncharacterized membrane protein